MATLGPLMGVEAFLDGSGMNPNEDQEFLQNINPQPIDPLNQNQFDPNEYGLQTQVNDQTFTPDPGMTLQDMLAQRDLQNSFPSTSPLSFQYTQPQGIAFNNPVGGLDQYAREMEALETARGGQEVSVNELGGTLQDFYTNRNPGTNANTKMEVIDDNINFKLQPQNLGFIDPSTVPTEAIYDESMANALPGYNYNRFPNFNKNPTRFQNFKDGFGDIRNNFEDGFENVQDRFEDGFENVQDTIGSGIDKFKSGLGSIKDFAIDKGNMGKNLLGSAGAMALGLPGIVGSGVMSLLSKLGDTADYQQYDPNVDYSDFNPNMEINDFYDPRTNTNRFQRAKPGSFASFRTGADYFKARREKKAAAKIIADQKTAAKEQQAIESIRQQYASQGRDYGQGAASQATQDSYQDSQGSYAGASTQDYGGGEKDGGMIGYREGGLASMFTRRR